MTATNGPPLRGLIPFGWHSHRASANHSPTPAHSKHKCTRKEGPGRRGPGPSIPLSPLESWHRREASAAYDGLARPGHETPQRAGRSRGVHRDSATGGRGDTVDGTPCGALPEPSVRAKTRRAVSPPRLVCVERLRSGVFAGADADPGGPRGAVPVRRARAVAGARPDLDPAGLGHVVVAVDCPAFAQGAVALA
jgi:hypothetical protein